MNSIYVDIFLAIALSGLISFLTNYLLVNQAKRLSLIDNPNHRSSHSAPTPRGGGLGIVLGYTVSSFILWNLLSHSILIWISLLLGWLIAAVGFHDDMKSSSAVFRLLFQMLTVFLLMLSLQHFAHYHLFLLRPLSYCLIIFAFFAGVWLINLYNFMDGINGLAASETVFVLLAAAFTFYYFHISGIIPLYMLILAAACSGFFFWNFPKARIFMGDTGSLFLGFMITFFAMYTILHRQLSLFSWLIWLSVFWVDASYTLLIRFLRHQRIHTAHRSHLYQILSRRLQSHAKVVGLILGYNLIWLFPLGFLSIKTAHFAVLYFLMAIIPLIIAAIYFGAGKQND